MQAYKSCYQLSKISKWSLTYRYYQCFVPAIILGFFEIILKALTFDFYDVGEYTQKMFGISEEEADEAEFDGSLTSEAELESRLAQLGYESGFMPINFGTLLYIILV